MQHCNTAAPQAGARDHSMPTEPYAHRATAILDFWFGALDPRGMPDPAMHGLWFRTSEETDLSCRRQFGDDVWHALAGALAGWPQSDRGLVALVILLDQFTRNIFRGTPAAFSGDERALALALAAVDAGRHLRMPAIHRVFLYLPLEHSEVLAHQEHCLRLFDELIGANDLPAIVDFRRYAAAHRDVIARFGRFPHRNAILGRESTAEELDYLAQHGGF